ncbi:hypothetical protein [Reyranella sp.]|uniref:hypothetical protein n=1 Tax=Reyranella sp. TaxID=1929291 RepID=UPI002F95B8FD
MTTNEFYYLILVCGAFMALGIGLAIATIRYWRSYPDVTRAEQPATKEHLR